MSKLLAKKIYREGKNIVLVTTSSEYHLNLVMNELKDIESYDVTIKKNKESRSIRQNNMYWAIVSKISDAINASHRQEDIDKIHEDVLIRANVMSIVIPPVKVEVKTLLKRSYRLVVEHGNGFSYEGNDYQGYKCYLSSTMFDTKEMGELIDCALDYASEVGIYDSEIERIRGEYL